MKFISKRLSASLVKKWVIPSIGVLALIIFSSLILFEATKATVEVTQNDEKETVKTHSNTVEELLDELEVVVGEHDKLSHDVKATVEDGMQIEYKQATKLSMTIDGVEKEFYTTEDVLEDFLQSEGLVFSKHDDVSFKDTDDITEGLSLEVTTAYEIIINDGGEEKAVWTTGGTVDGLLDEHDITLDKMDKVKPALDKSLKRDEAITITRVEKEKDIVEESIDFKVEKKEDNTLAKGKEKVISEGESGTLVKTFEITKENGKEVNNKLLSEEVKVDSKNKVVAVGTKEPEKPKQELVTLSDEKNTSSSSSGADGETIYMNATAYSANCNGCSGITATGINLNANPNTKVIAVDPSVIPLGTKVWVEGYGEAIAGDTGGAIKGNKIDVHVPTSAEASRYGWKKVKVKIIN